jgi:hypothetical protein
MRALGFGRAAPDDPAITFFALFSEAAILPGCNGMSATVSLAGGRCGLYFTYHALACASPNDGVCVHAVYSD